MISRLTDRYELVVVEEAAAPAAGADWLSPIGDNSRRLLINLGFTLTTAAAAAARSANLHIVHSGFTGHFCAQAATTQSASLIYRYTWAIGVVNTNNLTGVTFDRMVQQPLNPFEWIEPAALWSIKVDNIQAADQLSPMWYTYLREINPML